MLRRELSVLFYGSVWTDSEPSAGARRLADKFLQESGAQVHILDLLDADLLFPSIMRECAAACRSEVLDPIGLGEACNKPALSSRVQDEEGNGIDFATLATGNFDEVRTR